MDNDVNEEEDYIAAGDKLKEMFEEHGGIPETVFISDTEELQSYMIWWCMTAGLQYKRHSSCSYCEGFK